MNCTRCFTWFGDYIEPVVFGLGGIALGGILGLAFDPKEACGNYSSPYPITCLALGAIGIVANLYNTRLHSRVEAIPTQILEEALTSNHIVLERTWSNLSFIMHFLPGMCIGSALDTFGGLSLVCGASSRIFPIMLISFSAVGLTFNLINSRSIVRLLSSTQDNASETDSYPRTPMPLTIVPESPV